MTSLRTPRSLLALSLVTCFAGGCADDESPIGGLDESAGESESGESETGEEGGEEFEACIETVTVLADADTQTPEGLRAGAALDAALGTHALVLAAAEIGEGVSATTNAAPVLDIELVMIHENGELRYIDSVPSEGSAAVCAPRIEADLILSIASPDIFILAKFDAVLVAHIGDEGLEAPMILHEFEELSDLGDLELLEIEPADPVALSYQLGFEFSEAGVSGALDGVASYEEAGLEGDVAVSAIGFEMFVFSE